MANAFRYRLIPSLLLGALFSASISLNAGAQPIPKTAEFIGLNVDGFADWMSSAAFIDATAYFRRWGKADAGWEENPALRLSEDNYPLADADAVSFLRGYPDGIYTLKYEGQADIRFTGIAAIVPGSGKRSGNVTTGQVKLQHAGPEDILSLQVRGLDAKNPLKKLQLICPGYADATAVFRTEFVRRVRPFPTIRFMDWGQTNNNPLAEWARRPTPAMFSRTSAKGIPVEEMVALANLIKRNVWINVPLTANDDYIKQLATYLRDHLHKGATIHVEYSNEVWNFSFQQAKDNLFAARANGGLTKPDDFGRCAQNAADHLGKIAVMFKQVFGNAEFEKRVRPVIGGFIANTYWAQMQLDFLNANYPGLVKELAIAPYFGVEGDIKAADAPGATADQLFAACNDWIDTKILEWVKAHAKLAQDNNLALVAYEGGVHLTATNGLNEKTKQQMQYDPRMPRTLNHLLDVWTSNGGGMFCQFGHIGPYSKFGYWPLLESPDQKGTPKWDYYMSKLLPAGDANLDGKVNDADVAILKANFGKTGKTWEEGDFNGDGKVDGADAKLLRGNLRDSTPATIRELEKMSAAVPAARATSARVVSDRGR